MAGLLALAGLVYLILSTFWPILLFLLIGILARIAVGYLLHRKQTERQRNIYNRTYTPSYVSISSQTIPVIFARMNGWDFEQYCAVKLAEKGYTQVTLTPKSGDMGADIIAVDKDGKRWCFQCKLYSSPVGSGAVQKVVGAKEYYKCDKAAVMTNSTYTKAAFAFANRTGVELLTVREEPISKIIKL